MYTLENVLYKNVLNIGKLTIASGKITCLIGESGSGKTTLLKMLNHLVSCQQGVIRYKGEDLEVIDAINLRREVVMLPQTPVIFPGSIKDNLLIGLNFAQKKLPADKVLTAELNKVSINKELDERTDNLSGGEKQRLALARMILMQPETILLDEPTSALDDNTVEKVMAYILSYLKAGNKTAVMVTHSKQLAKKMADTIITMENGYIAAIEEVA